MSTYIFCICICIHVCIYVFIPFAILQMISLMICVLYMYIVFHPGQFVNDRFAKHSSTPTFSTAQYDPFSDSNADVVIVTDPPIVCPTAPEAVSFVNMRIKIIFGGWFACWWYCIFTSRGGGTTFPLGGQIINLNVLILIVINWWQLLAHIFLNY